MGGAIGVDDEGDGENSPGATIDISVAADQAPVLTQTATAASFTAGGSPVVIDSGITVTDPDNATLQYATVTLGGYISGEDQLTFPNAASDITVTQSAGVYTLTGDNASPNDFQNALDSLTYTDTSSNPTTPPRSLSVLVYDGQQDSNTLTYTIDVNAAGSGGSGGSGTAPTIFVPAAQSTDEGGSLVFSWGDGNAISVTDPNIGSGTDSMSLSVSNGTLTFGSTGSLASNSGNGTASLSISGTLAAIDAALDGLIYSNTSSTNTDTLAMTLTDSAEAGGPQTGNASVAIGITAAPAQSLAVTASTSSLYYNASAGAVAIDPGITVADNTNITGATIAISSGFVSGEDFLVFDTQNGISGTQSESGGVLTLTLSGPASAVDYQTALQSITYEDISSTPTTGSRAIALTVTDNQSNTASAGYTINVIPASSSLKIFVPSEQIGSEDNSLMFAWSGGDPISVADPNIGGGTDSMTLSVTDGTLDLGTSAGLASSSGNGTASITMSGTLAALDAALDGLEYFPGAEYTGSDGLNLSITDSAAPAGEQNASGGVVLSITPAVPEPTFSLGPDQAIPTGVGAQTIPGWASGMTAGLPDNGGATLSFVISVPADNDYLFAVLPKIDPNGDLTYTPATGASGVANISVQLEAASTATGTPGISYASTFTITLGSSAEPQLVTPPAAFVPGDGTFAFGLSNSAIYIGGDTDSSAQATVTITTSVGTLDYSVNPGDASTDPQTVIFSGSIADLNEGLATLVLDTTGDEPGSGTVTVSLTSSSTGSQGGTISVTNVIPLTIVDPAAASPDISVSVPTGQAVPENEALTFSSATGNPITVNADPAAEAEVTITAVGGDLSIGSSDGFGNSSATLTGTVADIDATLDGVEFSSANYGTPQLTVIATLLDDSGNPTAASAAASASITVRQSPYFNAYTAPWLNDEPQYSAVLYQPSLVNYSVLGTAVADVLDPPDDSFEFPNGLDGPIGSGDLDTNGLLGVAITGLDTQYGTWQYSPDDGGGDSDNPDWTSIAGVSDTNALLLDSTDYIRFVPNAGYFGDINDAVTFRLWDETTGTALDYADVSDNGGTTAFSADTATAALRVDPLVSITGGGGQYTISTTSDVPAALDVSGVARGVSALPFTVVIPADKSSTTLDLSTLAGLTLPVGGSEYTFTVALVDPGTVDTAGDAASLGYDYQVDPSAGSVSTTETATSGNEVGGFASAVQDGNTIQLTLDNYVTTNVTWSTVDGTAVAGQEYQSASGSVSAGQSATATITLDDGGMPGDSGFLIAMTGTQYGNSVTQYYPVIIQANAVQLLADSNNDGRIDATSDAAANATALADDTGGVLVNPDSGNVAGLTGPQLISAGQLVEVDLVFNAASGGSVTLTEQGDTDDFVVWANPSMTCQIDVSSSGKTWPAASAPTAVWIEAPELGTSEDGSSDESSPAITLALVMQNSSGGKSSPASVRVQAAAILDAKIVDDDTGSPTFNAPSSDWLSGTPTKLKQGPYVPVDNEDLDNNGIPDDLQPSPVATDNMLPIAIRNPDGAAVTQGNGYYTIGGGNEGTDSIPTQIRIWLAIRNSADPKQAVYTLVDEDTELSPGDELFVEGEKATAGSNKLPVITLVWNPENGNPVPLGHMQINVFNIVGPRDVPDLTTYQYLATAATGKALPGSYSAGGAITSSVLTNPSASAGQFQVTWAAAPGGAWGKVDFSPSGSGYTWAAHIAVVGITFGTTTFSASGTPAQVPGMRAIDSTNTWATTFAATGNPGLPATPLPAAMTASVTVTSIIGPKPLPGWIAPDVQFGVTHIQIGFAQELTVKAQNVKYNNSNSVTTSGSGKVEEGETYIDGITSGFLAPTSTITNRQFTPFPLNPVTAGYDPTVPWYGQTNPGGSLRPFFTPSGPVAAPLVFSAADTPSMVNMRINPQDPADIATAVNIDWLFTTSFVVHTLDTDSNPAGFSQMAATYNLASNVNVFTKRVVATWEFNGSGTLAGGVWTGVGAGVASVPANTNSMTIVSAPAPGTTAPTLNQQSIVLAKTKTTVNGVPQDSFFNALLNAD